MNQPLANYVVKIYGMEGGDRSNYYQTANIAAVVKSVMKERGIRSKSYESKTYPGLWPIFHEWTCTRGISVVAHEIG